MNEKIAVGLLGHSVVADAMSHGGGAIAGHEHTRVLVILKKNVSFLVSFVKHFNPNHICFYL